MTTQSLSTMRQLFFFTASNLRRKTTHLTYTITNPARQLLIRCRISFSSAVLPAKTKSYEKVHPDFRNSDMGLHRL